MPVISLFKFDKLPSVFEIAKVLNGQKLKDAWIVAKPSKYNKDEIFINYWYYEDVEESLNRVFSEEDGYEVVSFLKDNGKSRVLKRTYCFISLLTKTLEIYRGPDMKTEEIVSTFEEFLKVKFASVRIEPNQLQQIYSNHSTELKQVMFTNVEGLIFNILRGNFLENNEKFRQYLQKFPDCLRAISFRPKIRFLNNFNKYQVTLNGGKGTLRISSNSIFNWRPRYEIRQIVFIVAATLGLLQTLNR